MKRDERRDLNPTILDRIRRIYTPGWFRSVLIRRTLAIALIVSAVISTAAQQQGPPSTTALVAVRDLRPGDVLVAGDVRATAVPDNLAPPDQITVNDIVGRHVAGLVQGGEIIGRHRLLDSRLPTVLTGRPDTRLVPVRPADDTLAAFVRTGDLVDLLSQDAQVLARNAVVAATPDVERAPSTESGTVLVAMDESDAHRVASAGLRDPITFVLH